MSEKIIKAEQETNPNPTESQKLAGNYKKGKVTVRGFLISIENPKGSIRSGRSPDGKVWSIKQKSTYGYFKNTVGKDKDQVDVYLGEFTDTCSEVYIVDQVDPKTGIFDEHKVMFGYKSIEHAKKSYLDNFEKGWRGLGAITPMSLSEFKSWLYNSEQTSKPITKIRYKMSARKTALLKMEGEVLEGVTLKKLQSQLPTSFNELILEIASPGGSVSEGLEIMKWLDELSSKGVFIVTVVTANAYSIASMIMLVANLRIINKYGEIMVHNPMTPELKNSNASELEQEAIALRQLESAMHEIYSAFTKLSREEIKSLMDNETFFGYKDAIRYGFAHEVVDLGKREYKMLSKKEVTNSLNKSNMSKAINLLNRVASLVSGSSIVNQLYHTLEGGSVEIYQQNPDMYQVGDKTDLQEGTVTLGDGTILTIKDFQIVEAQPATVAEEIEIEVKPEEEPMVEQPVVPAEEPVVEQPAAVAEVVPTEQTPVEPMSPPSETPIISEPGVVEPMVEQPVQPMVEDTPEQKLAKLEESINKKIAEIGKAKDEQIQILSDKLKGLENSNSQMQLKITSLEESLESHKAYSAKFEEVAAQAIDEIAKGTSSVWKPEMKSVVPASSGKKSIFQEIQSRTKSN